MSGTATAGGATAGSTATGTGTSGAAGSAATAGSAAGMTYRLTGGNNDELQKYLNSRVEVKGTLQRGGNQGQNAGTGAGAGSSSATGTGTGTGTGSGAAAGVNQGSQGIQNRAGRGNMQTLRVTSVTQLSPTCTER